MSLRWELVELQLKWEHLFSLPAVIIHLSLKMDPPQLKRPFRNKAIWYGNWFSDAKLPPTIRTELSKLLQWQYTEKHSKTIPITNFISLIVLQLNTFNWLMHFIYLFVIFIIKITWFLQSYLWWNCANN